MAKLADEIFITFDGERICFRPSLRAAMRLDRRYGGFESIVKALSEQSLSVMTDVVRETTESPSEVLRFLEYHAATDKPFALKIGALVEPLISVVLAMAGVDPDEEIKECPPSDSTPGVSFEDHFERLYRLATGWLGYTPAVALDSTPAEITEAYKGRVEMLRAIFGSADDKPEAVSYEDASAGLAALRAMSFQHVGDTVRIY